MLDRLVVAMYARGLSTRDIEVLLGGIDDGDGQSLLGRSSVSRVTEVLSEEFARRDLGDLDVLYLFADVVLAFTRGGCRYVASVRTFG
ncbi:MAG: transposase [Phycisphaerae bacterium]